MAQKRKRSSMKNVTFRIPGTLRELVDKLAKKHDMNPSILMRWALNHTAAAVAAGTIVPPPMRPDCEEQE